MTRVVGALETGGIWLETTDRATKLERKTVVAFRARCPRLRDATDNTAMTKRRNTKASSVSFLK
jgi:hypothetical protein